MFSKAPPTPLEIMENLFKKHSKDKAPLSESERQVFFTALTAYSETMDDRGFLNFISKPGSISFILENMREEAHAKDFALMLGTHHCESVVKAIDPLCFSEVVHGVFFRNFVENLPDDLLWVYGQNYFQMACTLFDTYALMEDKKTEVSEKRLLVIKFFLAPLSRYWFASGFTVRPAAAIFFKSAQDFLYQVFMNLDSGSAQAKEILGLAQTMIWRHNIAAYADADPHNGGDNFLHRIARKNPRMMTRFLPDTIANNTLPEAFAGKNTDGDTPLHILARSPHAKEFFQALTPLVHNVIISDALIWTDAQGDAPLHVLAKNESVDASLIMDLMKCGPVKKSGRAEKDERIDALLLGNGEKERETPLHILARKGAPKTAALLFYLFNDLGGLIEEYQPFLLNFINFSGNTILDCALQERRNLILAAAAEDAPQSAEAQRKSAELENVIRVLESVKFRYTNKVTLAIRLIIPALRYGVLLAIAWVQSLAGNGAALADAQKTFETKVSHRWNPPPISAEDLELRDPPPVFDSRAPMPGSGAGSASELPQSPRKRSASNASDTSNDSFRSCESDGAPSPVHDSPTTKLSG